MKRDIIHRLETLKIDLKTLKNDINKLEAKTVNKKSIRDLADKIASDWVENIRSVLEYKFRMDETLIKSTSELMKQLHIISRPSNLKTSYEKIITPLLAKFDDRFILPVKLYSSEINALLDLTKIIPLIPDSSESEYMDEAIKCVNSGYYRAGIVMGWCAAIDKLQKAIQKIGFDNFNRASTKIKNQTSGKYKRWTKEFNVSSLAELQTVFDDDLIIVCEGMELFDGNQTSRLEVCFQYRNNSAHPGLAPIDEPHIVAFFSDINSMIFQNSKINGI